MRRAFYIIICLHLLVFQLKSQQNTDYKSISAAILLSDDAEEKLKLSSQLNNALMKTLANDSKPTPLDSTALLFDIISSDNQFQLISYAIDFNGKWEYYGIIKSYNSIKKVYELYDLVATPYQSTINGKEIYNNENWPAGVYMKLTEREYHKRKYYTIIGWLAPEEQTAFKFIEVLSFSKSGKPYFGKTNYFKEDNVLLKRKLFSYNKMSKFLLDFGKYDYSIKKWNKKKRKYEYDQYSDDLIVFDHLISSYPQYEELSEFKVPVGNLIDAYKFEGGKWIYISDIDARNLKQKEKKKEAPELNLFDEPHTNKAN